MALNYEKHPDKRGNLNLVVGDLVVVRERDLPTAQVTIEKALIDRYPGQLPDLRDVRLNRLSLRRVHA
ncbi:MAG: hypothetical protein QM704_00440 [Anaeromyxobacteraceae bacterium]